MNDQRQKLRREGDRVIQQHRDDIRLGVSAKEQIDTHEAICELRFAVIQKTLFWLIGIVTGSTAFLVITMSQLLLKG